MKYLINLIVFLLFFNTVYACGHIHMDKKINVMTDLPEVLYFIRVNFKNKRSPRFSGLIAASKIREYPHYFKLVSRNNIPRLVEGFDKKGKKTRIIKFDAKGLLVSSVTFPFVSGDEILKCKNSRETNYEQVCSYTKR